MLSWDENKRSENRRKHGIDFAELGAVFDHPMLSSEDIDPEHGEYRIQSLGRLGNRIVFLVWTDRNEHAHLISCRYADRKEASYYYARFGH